MLELVDINKIFGEFCLQNINLKLKKGEYFVLLGPTGTGKTVLIEIIAGLLRPDSGKIYINKQNYTSHPPEKRDLGVVYQDYALFPHMNVRGNISYGLQIKKQNKKDINYQVEKIAEFMNISSLLSRYPQTLSGGEQQRTSLARALIINPELLLLDEPLSSLDVCTRLYLEKELKRIHRETGKTFIHVTHNFEEALNLADRIGVMNDGKLVQVGKPEEIFKRPNSKFVASFLGGENLFKGEVIKKPDDVKKFKTGEVEIQITTEDEVSEGYITIHPEEIILSFTPFQSSARNCFEGIVTEIESQGFLCKVTVDIGIPLVSLITKKSLEEMEIRKDQKIFLTFKTSSVHFFEK